MKKISTFVISRMMLISLFSLGGFIFSIALINTSKETRYLKSVDSRISIISANADKDTKIETTAFNCDANFVVEDDKLIDISNFQFTIQVNQFKSENKQLELAVQNLVENNKVAEIKFVQERVMVLPTMKMIHLIGKITIANVNQSISFQLAYHINANNELLIEGKQSICLNELGIIIPLEMKHVVKNKLDIKLNLKMIEGARLIN